jgi:predicted Zn-dependent protease
MGIVLAARAGYDPYGFVGVLQMLAQVKETGRRRHPRHPPVSR